MTSAVFIVLALGLLICAFIFKKMWLAFGASGGWLLFGLSMYTASTTPWDIFYGGFWFGLMLALMCGLFGMGMREKSEPPKRMTEEERQKAQGYGRPEKRKTRTRDSGEDSDFARTGRIK